MIRRKRGISFIQLLALNITFPFEKLSNFANHKSFPQSLVNGYRGIDYIFVYSLTNFLCHLSNARGFKKKKIFLPFHQQITFIPCYFPVTNFKTHLLSLPVLSFPPLFVTVITFISNNLEGKKYPGQLVS